MSRIIIKNLPKNITDTKLREIFGAKGHVTDVQLKYTPDGKFRQFAFIGYKEEAEANEAIEYFDKTSINTNKITVQKCSQLGDASKPKSWSKYAVDSSAYKSKHKTAEPAEEEPKVEKDKSEPTQDLLEKYKDDHEFEEFLNVQGDKNTQNLLSKIKKTGDDEQSEDEDEAPKGDKVEDDNKEEEEEKEKIANAKISDLEYMKMLKKNVAEPEVKKKKEKPRKNLKLFTLKMRNLPNSCKKKDIKAFFKPLYLHSLRCPKNIRNIAFVGFLDEKNFKIALTKDRSFIKGKQIEVKEYVDYKNEPKEQANDVNNKWKYQEEKLKNEEEIAESGKIFIRNLSYTSTEDEVQKLFETYGPIADFTLPIDTTTRKPKGFATVTFVMPENAVKAYTELDGTIFHGRMLHLLRGKSKENADDDNEETTDFKKKKAKELKKKAGSSHNWNSLFLGHDAVAEVMANTYGTTKEAVLDPRGAGNAAVRLALGETQIIAQTRKHLEDHGVILDAFNGVTTKRSKTIIIVKNLPANTTSMDIQTLFHPHGHLGRVILPPSGITAIVEFVEPSEAKKAFTRLAYTKFKNLPLYLEWAPDNSLSGQNNRNVKEPTHNETKPEEPVEVVEEEEDDDEEPEPDTTLFVKNLNFETTDNVLRKHFASCGKISYANVVTKKDLNDPTKKLSMGYGFVRFYHKESINKALKNLQQSVLDGKSLELKRSERTLSNEVVAERKTTKKIKQTGSKICVRNVPFQANQQDLLELFKTFGEIKSLRLPKKMGPTNQHRGFGFVDFATNADAKKAFEALSQSTHVLGRRLVLEWAATEDSIDDIRKRTADHFHETTETKRSKKSVFEMES
ncbi:PREDICTED: probable RNA-binding protein 19 [Nicrophorus vespilloides]|uniref:Probable RNA-binding protein 19 n=1 Tax=Nicrophorus vespilloides TaxID=110193 RepID=A0ABM1M876_NICVS|nr:PREDICTED: probable RNA-binding protein 19 [Nicrophorus vespilloides]